jgi:hypothetical protein
MKILFLFVVLSFLAPLAHCGGEDLASENDEMINKCIDMLVAKKSSNIFLGGLSSEWDSVWVRRDSITGSSGVIFQKNTDDPRHKDTSFISDGQPITCSINDNGAIYRLTSPEIKQGNIELTDWIEPDHEYEELQANYIVSEVLSGREVYTYDWLYAIAGRKLTIRIDLEIKKLDKKIFSQ